MKNQFWIALPLAATLAFPAFAQQNSPSQDQTAPVVRQQTAPPSQQVEPATPTPEQTPAAPQQTPDQAQADQNLQARQPLKMETHEGFWGKLNPFARKKYVQRQLTPIQNRVNELDELTAANAKNIKDVDARAQQGIQMASAKATEADQKALQAGQTAQQAQQTATQAQQRVQSVEQVVTNLDQYKPVTDTEILFRPGQTVLSKKAKDALDQMTQGLANQKGYIIQVQGFSAGRGQAAIEQSQRMAEAVRRYLVLSGNVPVYRIHVLGMGNAPVEENGKMERVRGARVDVSLLKNDLEQLSSAQPMYTGAPQGQAGMSGAATSVTPAQANAPVQQPTGVNAPASQPQQQKPSPAIPPQQ
jgi:outer membrane protein OmpA-like peptidoglycan-associated protein